MKSKNTVLTRYFWDKMLTDPQNLQAELRALSTNSTFVASFIDDVSFVLPEEGMDTITTTAFGTQQPEKPTEVVLNSSVEVGQEQSKPNKNVVAKPEEVTTHAKEALELPELVDHAGKVVVLAQEKPTAAEISFLNKILAAVAVEPASVVYIYQKFMARELSTFASAKIVLSFGAVSDFEPDHQVRSKAITVIIAKSLAGLEQDVEAKKKLWLSMKGFFK